MTLEERLHRLHEGRFGADGLIVRAVITGCVAEGEAVLEGELVNPDVPRGPKGDIKRRYIRTTQYAAEVFNAGLGVPKPYRGRGFSSSLSQVVEAGYWRENIRFVRLTAGRDVGGIAWASTYDFDDERLPGFGDPNGDASGVGLGGEQVRLPDEGNPRELRVALTTAIADAATRSSRITGAERAFLDEYLPELVNPALIRALPQGIGERMLRGSRWPGVKDLQRVYGSD